MSQEHPPLPAVKDRGQHVPVLLDASLELLQPKKGETYLDLTAGYGGHARRFLDNTENFTGAVLVDRDEAAIAVLEPFLQKGARLLNTDFADASRQLVESGKQFDIVLVDLGVSSPQLDRAQRGFSFTRNGPLDMRMDQRLKLTAEELINTIAEGELARIIAQFGEESPKSAQRIARAVVEHRPFRDTGTLAALIERQYRGKRKKTHPATRTFQALRIVINDELGQIERLLPLLPDLLTSKGRVGIISFHSLEDRLVKRYFSEQDKSGYEAELRVINKKPLEGASYDANNPRARSAKLRAAAKK